LNSTPPSASYAPKTSGTPLRATNRAMSRSNAAPSALFGEPNVVGQTVSGQTMRSSGDRRRSLAESTKNASSMVRTPPQVARRAEGTLPGGERPVAGDVRLNDACPHRGVASGVGGERPLAERAVPRQGEHERGEPRGRHECAPGLRARERPRRRERTLVAEQ